MRSNLLAGVLLFFVMAVPCALGAQETPRLTIHRAAGPITIDGDLADPGWQDALRVDTFWETKRGENATPPAATVAHLAYDDHFFYAAFEFADPHPDAIRAPLGDHDGISGDTDYGGVILDARNDGKTAILFLANPRNVQYDAVTNDASGEDSSPDFFWDSATRITREGWVLEMRIPFSSLRYKRADPQTWGILLYRNYPRDFHYQMFSAPLPRGSNCFICHENKLDGLSGLPAGGHLVVAPYGTARQSAAPEGDLGTPLHNGPVRARAGIDVKWTPSADSAIDATFHPDFSQVESDVAQISTDERFALFYPEKRPFFLEGIDLFQTPLQAVYTRTLTSPAWGARATGKLDDSAYTLLVTQDRGGGSVVLPGPLVSSFADQDFSSTVAIGRLRHEWGGSFASLLVTDREVSGGAHNRVLGPDFRWHPNDRDSVNGQLLLSDTVTPRRPDLAAEWDGRHLASHAADLNWYRSTKTYDVFVEGKDIGDDFRTDVGFLPQVGIRETYSETGWSFYPQAGALNHIRPFFAERYTAGQDGDLLLRRQALGTEIEGRFNTFSRVSYQWERVRAGNRLLERPHLQYHVEISPSRLVGQVSLDGFVGDDVDVDGARRGTGGLVTLGASLRPGNSLAIRVDASRRWLDLPQGRLFTAQVGRVKATYTFTARCFLRLIGQTVQVDQDPLLAAVPVTPRSKDFTGSALFAYKLDWQTVLFVGYGDERSLADLTGRLERANRELFLKVSYAWQR
ncbi:MAG TPA: DUF5916 domain-containing protein [Thermoanaerobaculia bacterium]|nr:DUF5916 domain-containing protein [Thermoanaerobaculia bacterium]